MLKGSAGILLLYSFLHCGKLTLLNYPIEQPQHMMAQVTQLCNHFRGANE